MSTPGSVEFNKDVLLVVDDDVIKSFSDNNLNWLIIIFRNILTLKIFGKFSSLEILDELD